MKINKMLFVVFFSFLLTIIGCAHTTPTNEASGTDPDPAHNAENSLDWAGKYEGSLPNFINKKNKKLIKVRVTLNQNGTYLIEQLNTKKIIRKEKGNFAWVNNNSYVGLQYKNVPLEFQVGEGVLELKKYGDNSYNDENNPYLLKQVETTY